ncbi:MAG: hypothetical protein R2834_04480 [Rhodothermales bacterium]
MNKLVHRSRVLWMATIALLVLLAGAQAASGQSRSGTNGRGNGSGTEKKEAPAPKSEAAPARSGQETSRSRSSQPESRQSAPQRREEASRGGNDSGQASSRSSSRTTDRRAEPAQRSQPERRAEPAPRNQPERRAEPAQRSQPERRAEPAQRSQPERRAEPERRGDTRAQPERRGEPERRVEPERRNEPVRRAEPQRRLPTYETGRDRTNVYRRDHPDYYRRNRPDVHVSVRWPWQYRYQRHWEPHYRYRQVVYLEVGWGSRRRTIDVDVRTRYHQRVRNANGRYAEVDIFIDAIEIYRNGRFMGEVNRIPNDLAHIVATIYRDGDVAFDRDVFLVGDPVVGFEMISTRSYDGYILDRYRDSHGYRVGELNLRRQRVYSRRHSRLFNPRDFNGYPPISLLPDDRNLLADFGDDALSYRYYRDDDYDPYFGGRYNDPYQYEEDGVMYNSNPYDGYNPQSRLGEGNGYQYDGLAPRVSTSQPQTGPYVSSSRNAYKTEFGADISIKRDIELERIK